MAAERPFRLSPAAKADLRQIWRYTVRRWSLEQAETYQDQLYAAFEGLAVGTKKGRDVDVRPGYLKDPAGSHIVYFRDRGDRIEIIRILHGRMDAMRHLQ